MAEQHILDCIYRSDDLVGYTEAQASGSKVISIESLQSPKPLVDPMISSQSFW